MSRAKLRRIARKALLRAKYDRRFTDTNMIRASIPKAINLFGESIKTQLSETVGYITAVLYLAPGSASGRNTCPNKTAACEAACLGTGAGQLAFDHARNSQYWKTLLWFSDRTAFEELLTAEIAALQRKASKLGKRAAVRVDGTSDLGIGQRIASENSTRFSDVWFYDYTKSPQRAMAYVDGKLAPNYHLAFSATGKPLNEATCIEVLKRGGYVAVVFDCKKDELPKTWNGFPIVNGDKYDVFFEHPRGSVLGLHLKANKNERKAEARRTEFVYPAVNT